MANCNCNDFPISCAPHAPGGDCHHHHGCPPHPVCPPPEYKGGTSMYIGARYVPIFADPVEWDNEREYEPLTIVIHNGNMYTSKCYVPKGAPLPEFPETQTKYWVCTADYNYQFADLKQTVLDLSRLVEQFQKDNETFTTLINGWNEQVKAWEAKMDDWQTTVDGVTRAVADLTAKLNEEITRAKAAEEANKAAIEAEASRADTEEKAIRADFAAADTAEKEAREAADTALGERIDNEAALREAGDNAIKALIEQEQTRAEGEEAAIRHDFAAADTALSNRITSNKTDIDSIKAEQAVQNTNISANAKNISDNAAEIAKHADRLTALESNASDWDSVFPDTTIAQEVQKEELARANADTAINGRIDAQASDIEELRDTVNHKVDQTTYTADQSAQDTKIKANADAIAAMDTAYKAADAAEKDAREKADAALSASITAETDRATDRENEIEAGYKKAVNDLKTEVSGDFVIKTVYDAGQAAQDKEIAAVKAASGDVSSIIGDWTTDHPGQTISECTTSIENEVAATDAKADANTTTIGAWSEEHPGKTISQAVSDKADKAEIPDTSLFVSYADPAHKRVSTPNIFKNTDMLPESTTRDRFWFMSAWNTDDPTSFGATPATNFATVKEVTAEKDARKAADTALGERIEAEKNRASLREDNIEADFSGDIGNWSASYPTSTITDEVTALKTRHYATLKDLFAAEQPQLIPFTSTVVCSTANNAKTTVTYTDPTVAVYLPENITCDEYTTGPITGDFRYTLAAIDVSTHTVELFNSTANNVTFTAAFDPSSKRLAVAVQESFITEVNGKQYDFAIPTLVVNLSM